MQCIALITSLICLFLGLGAVAGPYAVRANQGKMGLAPLAAVAEFLDGTLAVREGQCTLTARGKTLTFRSTDIYSAARGDVNDWPGMAFPIDGLLYADADLLAREFDLQLSQVKDLLLTAAQSGKQLALPMRAVLPDLCDSADEGSGILLDGEPYLQLSAPARLLGGSILQEFGNRTVVTLYGHTVVFTPFSSTIQLDGNANILEKPAFLYGGRLYITAADFARLFELTPAPVAADELQRLFDVPADTLDDAQAMAITHPITGITFYATTFKQFVVTALDADFDGDGVKETAYARRVPPGGNREVRLWIQKGSTSAWQLRLPASPAHTVVNLHARDLTGDGVPELVFGCWLTGAYTGSVGFAAYRWDAQRKLYSNVLGSDTRDGFLPYTAEGGDGGILFNAGGKDTPPALIRYQTVEWRQRPQRYTATWYAWDGRFFVRRTSKTTKTSYDISDTNFKIQQVFNEMGITGVSLLRGLGDR